MENRNLMMVDDRKSPFMVADDGKLKFYVGGCWIIVILWWWMMENRNFMVADDGKS